MNLLNFARMCWQLKDYNFKGSSVHIINILKGHILTYSNIWRRSLKSELFLSVQKKFQQNYHSRNQKVQIYHPLGIFLYVFLWSSALLWVLCYYVESLLLVLTGPLHSGVTKEQNWGHSIQTTFIQDVHCNIKIHWFLNIFVSDVYLPLKDHK